MPNDEEYTKEEIPFLIAALTAAFERVYNDPVVQRSEMLKKYIKMAHALAQLTDKPEYQNALLTFK